MIPKPEKKSATVQDVGAQIEYEGIPYDLVIDGKIMFDNLKVIGKDYMWLNKEVKKFGYLPEEALIVTIDGKNQIFAQKKGEKS